jgi:hypothetical protein
MSSSVAVAFVIAVLAVGGPRLPGNPAGDSSQQAIGIRPPARS